VRGKGICFSSGLIERGKSSMENGIDSIEIGDGVEGRVQERKGYHVIFEMEK
jgi:hypothetical protein